MQYERVHYTVMAANTPVILTVVYLSSFFLKETIRCDMVKEKRILCN